MPYTFKRFRFGLGLCCTTSEEATAAAVPPSPNAAGDSKSITRLGKDPIRENDDDATALEGDGENSSFVGKTTDNPTTTALEETSGNHSGDQETTSDDAAGLLLDGDEQRAADRESESAAAPMTMTHRGLARKKEHTNVDDDEDDYDEIAEAPLNDSEMNPPVAGVSRELEEEKAMMCTTQGKALKFIQAVIELHESLRNMHPELGSTFSTVAVDELVWLTERMIAEQEDMTAMNNVSSTHVDSGYHYTTLENLSYIRTKGLLTRKERSYHAIESMYNRSSYGDGIYTCNSATKYCSRRRYGPIGLLLLVARLKGVDATSYNTYSSNSLVVLRSCAQCVPLIQFTSVPGDLLVLHHCKLQALIDVFFNDEMATEVSTATILSVKPRSTPRMPIPHQIQAPAPPLAVGPTEASGPFTALVNPDASALIGESLYMRSVAPRGEANVTLETSPTTIHNTLHPRNSILLTRKASLKWRMKFSFARMIALFVTSPWKRAS
jgi:hypothetical protein